MAVGDLVVNLMARTDRFTRPLSAARGHLSKFTSMVGSAVGALSKLTIAGGSAIGGLSVLAVKLAADAEQTSIAFEVLTGSVEVASDLVKDLRTMGAKTPFQFTDLSKSAKLLMNYGRTANDVMGDLGMLSDIASGNPEKLHLISLAFGQIAANGRLMGQDLLQLVNAGFNPLQEIAKKTGESMMELRERMSKGLIPFEEVRQAFVAATSEGGRFFQMNEKQSKTLLGKWSTLKDEMTMALIEIGEAISKNLDLTGFITGIQKSVEALKKDFIPAVRNALSQFDTMLLKGEFLQKVAKEQGSFAAFQMQFDSKKFQAGFDAFTKERFKLPIKGAEKFNPEIAAIREKNIARQEALEKLRQDRHKMRAETTANQFLGNEMAQGASPRQAINNFAKHFEEVGKEFPGYMREWFEEFKAKQFKIVEGQESAQQARGTLMAEKMVAGLIRNGIEAVKTGVMSLGPPKEEEERLSHRTRTLEAGSAEAFEVLRANVGQQEKNIPKKQLKEAEKTNKLLEKWAKSKDPYLQMNALFIKGLD